jgi:hypothetical protein
MAALTGRSSRILTRRRRTRTGCMRTARITALPGTYVRVVDYEVTNRGGGDELTALITNIYRSSGGPRPSRNLPPITSAGMPSFVVDEINASARVRDDSPLPEVRAGLAGNMGPPASPLRHTARNARSRRPNRTRSRQDVFHTRTPGSPSPAFRAGGFPLGGW